MANKADFYAILGVKADSTAKDIKDSYRKLASKHHPDKAGGNEEQFKKIQEAYDTLGDRKRKAKYDENRMYGNDRSYDFDMDGFRRAKQKAHAQYGGGYTNYTSDDLRDMFSTRAGSRAEPIPKIHISLEDAYKGRHVISAYGSVHTPAGIRSHTKMMIGTDRKIVEIIVDPHPKLKRTLDDLLLTVDIDVRDVLVGSRLRFKHLDGREYEIKIQAGTQPKGVMRIGGKGMKNPETDKYGDLLIECNIIIPVLTTTEKAAIIAIHNPRTVEV